MNRNLYNLLRYISKHIYPDIDTMKYISPLFKLISHFLKHNGTLYTVKSLKQMRLHITRYVCGQPLLVNDQFIGLTKEGWPTRLNFLKELADSKSLQSKKFLFTLLMISRTLIPKKTEVIPFSTSSITDPYCGIRYKIPNHIIRDFVMSYNLKAIKPEFSLSSLYFSMKSGPNGPATLSIPKTLMYFGYTEIAGILGLLPKNGREWFSKLLEFCSINSDKILTSIKSNKEDSPRNWETSSRLSIVKDPECKMRVIGIVDYVTQVTLSPISDILFGNLKRIHSDRTFTQSPLHNWEDNSESFWSVDLSSATDRFPLQIQKELLAEIFSDKAYSESWALLLTGREYLDPNGNPLRYAVGQPMGAKSSWPAFTLAHHLIIFYCARLEGFKEFSQYIMLGDDIVIKNDRVAKRYISVLEKIGVKTSYAKTHVSKDTYEFAKRWIQGKSEISGLPLNGLVTNVTNPFITWYILFDYFVIKGNMYLCKSSLDHFVARLYSTTKLLERSNKKWITLKFVSFKKMLSKVQLFSFTMRNIFGISTYDEVRKFFAVNSRSNDYVVAGPNAILSEMHRVFGNAMNWMVAQQVKRIEIIYKDLNKINIFGVDRLELPSLPIWHAIRNRVSSLSEMQLKMDLSKITLKDAVETILLLDLDAVSQQDRKSFEIVMKAGQLTQEVKKHLNFDPEYTVPRMRSLSVVKATKDLHAQFRNEYKAYEETISERSGGVKGT